MTERSYIRRPGESLAVSGGAVIEVVGIDAANGEVTLAVESKGPIFEGEDLTDSRRGYRTADITAETRAARRRKA